ncbi:hypothetical protein [Nannocystis pusilla]|nr:hypothetical protein [Nannocystis pusilla]
MLRRALELCDRHAGLRTILAAPVISATGALVLLVCTLMRRRAAS